MSLLDNITLDDLNEEQRQLAECIGLDAYKNLVSNYAGSFVYVCKADTITVNFRNEELKQKFNGYNYRELALEFNLSESSVRRIVSDALKQIKIAPVEGQTSLFE